MPSLTHEGILQLLRERPELAPQLLELTGLDVPAHDEVPNESSDRPFFIAASAAQGPLLAARH